tara:strand:+ start:2287 stop:2820 length:534 start_codon:yes stop_codon:yes gene_type:complete
MTKLTISNKYPILNIKNKVGDTSYIDFITKEQMTSNIMWGTDLYNRYFITINMNIDSDNKYNKAMDLMQTFFERYTNSSNLWMGTGHHGVQLIDTYGGMNDIQFKLIQDIIDNNLIKITKEHQPCQGSFIDKHVCNRNVYNAILKIQRAWRLCRYSPDYKMCERVQMNNLDEILNSQ